MFNKTWFYHFDSMSKRIKSAKSTKELMNIALKRVFSVRGKLFAELIASWTEIVGYEFNKKCYPVKIESVFEDDRKINLLHIIANDTYSSFIIDHKKEIIIERIAVYLGFKAIDRIKIKASFTI